MKNWSMVWKLAASSAARYCEVTALSSAAMDRWRRITAHASACCDTVCQVVSATVSNTSSKDEHAQIFESAAVMWFVKILINFNSLYKNLPVF